MRFAKNLVNHIRRRIAIDKAFCFLLLIWLVAFIATASFQISQSYLSSPPSKGSEPRQYTECRNINANDYLCSRLGSQGEYQTDTEYKKSNSAQYIPKEFIKDKRDLNAQEGMWRATNLLGYLTVFQVFIGIITVGVVGYTLLQTREILTEAKETTRQAGLSTKAAIRTAEAAENAELAHVFFTVKPKFLDPNNRTISKVSTELVLKNHGKSPATKVNYAIRLIAVDSDSYDTFAMGLGATEDNLVLGAGDSVKIEPLPDFAIQEYYWEADIPRTYVIGCYFGFSDVRGEVIREQSSSFFAINVIHRIDMAEHAVLRVAEIRTDQLPRIEKENWSYINRERQRKRGK